MPAAHPTPASLTPPFAFPAARCRRAVSSSADFGPAARAFGACRIPAAIAAVRCGPTIRMSPATRPRGIVPTAVERTAGGASR